MSLKFDDKLNKLAETEANEERIRSIEKCFGLDNGKLYQRGRVLVGEGVLMKMCRKKPKLRYFFLFNDVLLYGTSVIDRKKYINLHIIPLEQMQIKSIGDDEDPKLRNGWLILSPKKSFCVYATTPKEKTEWMMHINNCIDKLLNANNANANNSNNHNTNNTNNSQNTNNLNRINSNISSNGNIIQCAPQWIPDKNADQCMRCKTKFNVVNRRHHCRKCGFVVCGDCSKQKFLLIEQSDEPVRVCDACYRLLSNPLQKSAGSSIGNNPSDYITDSDESDPGDQNNTNFNGQPRFY